MEDDFEDSGEIRLMDPGEEQLKKLVLLQRQSQQQMQQAMQQVAQMQQQIAQMIAQALQQVAQTNQQVAAALSQLSAPRRRIPIRDEQGRITEAHDLPMSMQ